MSTPLQKPLTSYQEMVYGLSLAMFALIKEEAQDR